MTAYVLVKELVLHKWVFMLILVFVILVWTYWEEAKENKTKQKNEELNDAI